MSLPQPHAVGTTVASRLRRGVDEARRRPLLTSWAIATVALAAWLAAQPTAVWKYDARNYFALSNTFPHLWSFLSFDDDLRGYAFPWLLHIVRTFGARLGVGDEGSVRLLNLAIAPALLCILAPLLAMRLSTRCHPTIPRVLALNVLFFIAWRNDLLMPLSDIPALAFFCAGLLLILSNRRLATDLLAGGLLAFASTARPAYILGAAAAWAGLAIFRADRRAVVRRASAVAVGALLVLSPQLGVNLRHHHQFAVTPVKASSLTLFQLSQGLLLERYDTYLGDNILEIPPSMRFENPRVTQDLGRYHFFTTYGEYARYAGSHPFATARVFVRHLVNGLDTRFGGTYVTDLDDGDLVWPLTNYALLMVAVATIGVRRRRRGRTDWRSPTTYCMFVLAACCATSLAGAMEARFLMPMQLALFAVACFTVDRESVPTSTRMRAVIGAAVVVGVALAFSISASTMGHLVPFPMRADGSIIRPSP